jgi:signal transduction histidine kinase
VLSERIRLESISTAIGAIGVMAITFVMFLIFPEDIPQARYMGEWLAAQLIVGVFWLGFIAHHIKWNTPRTRILWPYLSTLVCSFFGFAWGAGWVFFIGEADLSHAQAAVIFTIILGGVFTGGVLATIFHLPSLLSFTLCSLLPPLISTFIHQSIFHLWFGVSIVVYMLACAAFALNLHSFLMETLEQREEKAWLAKQLEIEKKRVEQASHEKTRFLAAVSHDLRQPLQALQFFQHSLTELIHTEGQERQILTNMGASITALNGLLNAMLDVAQLDSGKHPVQRQTFALNTLFQRIHQQCAPLAAEHGLTLRYVRTCQFVHSDPMLLERIIQNLVHNAIKHMGQHGRIVLGARKQGDFLRIEVHDNGVGIPAEEQAAIFREFYQLHNPERKRSQGVGLGLAIVKRLLGALGHDLSLASQPDKGCRFAISVPLAAAPEANPTVSIPVPTQKTPHHHHILIAEDDAQVLESLQTLLALWGHTSIASSNPDPAILSAKHPDITFIISDYQLRQDLDGIALIQELRRLAGWEIPALLITGNTSPVLAEEWERLSIPVSYKPIKPSELKKWLLA